MGINAMGAIYYEHIAILGLI